MSEVNEEEVRRLRDVCYGVPGSDNEWETTKKNWLKPENVAWLKEHQRAL